MTDKMVAPVYVSRGSHSVVEMGLRQLPVTVQLY